MKEGVWRRQNNTRIWYMLCFALLGLIDQRRGSAAGHIQIAFSDFTGIVMAGMLLPSLDQKQFRNKIFLIWSSIALLGGTAVGVWGWHNAVYREQWIVRVLNIAVWGYVILYMVHERKMLKLREKMLQPFFLCMCLMFLFMFFSAQEGLAPVGYLIVFAALHFIGIPEQKRSDFFQGMLNGIILWFFVQQTIAFGFRPYDYVRYRGLYSGETQNGMFYMIAYCAFLCKWLWLRENGKKRWLSRLCFFLSAACVSFTLYSGGRAPLLGIGMATAAAYIWHDIVCKKSFYRLLGHGVLFLLCIAVSFPLVYGSIRYFPTILRHPIWFEGEYDDLTSVRSFDPPDSTRYISFERAVEVNLGRVLSLIGLNPWEWKEQVNSSMGGMKALASELEEPGSSPDNPFLLPGTDMDSSVDVRKVIYTYYFRHLNMWGHSRSEADFYAFPWYVVSHTHNLFLQMAYDHGIPAGLLFIGIYFYSIFCTVRFGTWEKKTVLFFLSAILAFGFFEMALWPGQITVALMGILFHFAGSKCYSVTV